MTPDPRWTELRRKAEAARDAEAAYAASDDPAMRYFDVLRAKRALQAACSPTTILALLAEADEAARLRWQPIETAPRGLALLLLTAGGSAVAGKFMGSWLTLPGHWSCKPTHWMPLPSPPALEPAP